MDLADFGADAFVYVLLLALVLINIFMWDVISQLKDRVANLERQMRELHRIVVANLPHED